MPDEDGNIMIAPTSKTANSAYRLAEQNLYVPDLQPDYPDMLLIRAIRLCWKSKGHWNAHDIGDYVDYHGTSPDYDINAVFDDVMPADTRRRTIPA